MLLGSGHRNGNGVSVLASGAAYALNILCLSRRHLAKHNCRQVTDIDTHFQRGRTGEQVWVPSLVFSFAMLKGVFKRFSIRTIQQACMLTCMNANRVTLAVNAEAHIKGAFHGFISTAAILPDARYS